MLVLWLARITVTNIDNIQTEEKFKYAKLYKLAFTLNLG